MKYGSIATGDKTTANAAMEILKDGGNAFDAAICAAALLGVVEAHSTGIGGDCFCIFYSQKENKVKKTLDYSKIILKLCLKLSHQKKFFMILCSLSIYVEMLNLMQLF